MAGASLLLLILAASINFNTILLLCGAAGSRLMYADQEVDSPLDVFGTASTSVPRPRTTLSTGSTSILIFQTSIPVVLPCIFAAQVITPPSGYAPPVHTVIATPIQNGTYPVILFKHGFMLANCFYIQLFEYLASSGYIVVAPQAVTVNPICSDEIDETAKVAVWIAESLELVLNAAVPSVGVVPNVSSLIMAGHSRGGKIAFALALGMTTVTNVPSFSALVTLDPVDGMGKIMQFIPQMVEAGCNHTKNALSIPVLILGTGYGSKYDFGIIYPCAPACCGHQGYFNCSSSPLMYHFNALDYGHLDFLDDSNLWTGLMCASGSTSKAPLRNFTGHLTVAFLQATLKGNETDMDYILTNWHEGIDSIQLAEPQIYGDDALMFKCPLRRNPTSGLF